MTIVRAIWRFLVGVKDALVLLFMLLFFGALWFALQHRGAGVAVPSSAALVLDLDGVIVDQATERSFADSLTGGALTRETQVRDLVRAIRAARDDGRVKAIVLGMDTFVGGGQANIQAVGAELDAFRAKGKPVYAYATAYLDDGYLLAAHANEIWVNPLGGVFLAGPGGSNLYFADALKRLGVTVNVFRVGTYKSFVEPFTRQDASPEAKAAEQALVDQLWRSFASDVRRARPAVDVNAFLANLPERVRGQAGDLARAALAAKLVDRIGTPVELGAKVEALVGVGRDDRPGGFARIDLMPYLSATRSLISGGGDAVGVVYVSGMIVDGEAGAGSAGGDTIAGLVEEALADDSIKALVVRVDSPGGSVIASERIRQAILSAKARGLPVVSSFGPVAASGGYWVGSAGETIFAEPSTITGSIGVFAIIPSFEKTLADLRIGTDGVKSTPYSGDPDLLDGLTPQTRELLQLSVEDIYRRFLGIVATSRRQTPAAIDRVAQGRVWDGVTAQKLGLVDRMGGLDAALAQARRRAGLAADARVVDIEPRRPIPYEVLASLFTDRDAAPAQDVVGKLVARQKLRFAGAAGGAAQALARPSVQALCAGCWNWSPAPAVATGGPIDWLKLAAAARR